MKVYHQSFEGFSEVTGNKAAGLADVFPLLRYLPDSMLPVRQRAKDLHRTELDLFVGHYRDTKQKLKAGTAKVGTSTLTILHIQFSDNSH